MLHNIKIAFIGSGNVAWHLSKALENAGYPVVGIFSRTKKNAEKLASKMYNATPTDQLDFSESNANLFFICVHDDSISQVCYDLKLPENSIVVHTSGSQPIEILKSQQTIKKGVFYPLQTFTKDTFLNIDEVPFCIEAENENTEHELVKIAQKISKTVYLVSSFERQILHISAVFACNFTNHLLALSKEILDREKLEFDLLKPLIYQTFKKAFEAIDPFEVQTGPAIRKDFIMMNKHLEYLKNDILKKEIYQLISDSIIETGMKLKN